MFYTPEGKPRLVAPGLLVLVATTAIVLLALHLFARPRTDQDEATALLSTGRAAEAEALEAQVVQRDPTVPHVLALVRTHTLAVAAKKLYEQKLTDRTETTVAPTPPMTEEALDAVLASLPPDVALFGRVARGSQEARHELESAAQRDPPLPWANHVLAEEARAEGNELEAASLFWREGTTFPERSSDVDDALSSWIEVGAWDEALEKMHSAHTSDRVAPHLRYQLAVHEGDWRAAARALPGMWKPRLQSRAIWLSAVAALAWAFFFARLGKLKDRPGLRAPLYLAAFGLGVVSVAPTIFLIAIEEAKLRLVETGNVARDILFFVFGVGLREEASKLLLFLPMLPVLRRWGDKLDVLVCGAMVGLGFAAEENLGYLADENLHTGLARFLTANFFHAAMTGILASALDDFVRDPDKHAQDFMRTSLLVVGMHGAYDFLISHNEMGGGFAAMAVFFLLAKLFLDTVDAARKRADRGMTPLHAFVVALAVVTGASLAHAINTVGFQRGPLVMAEGLLGEAILVLVFTRVLSRM